MELISLQYTIFILALLILYYIIPQKFRWIVLLAGSLFYYVYVCKFYVGFILFTIISTYMIARKIESMLAKQTAVVKEHKKEWDRAERKAYKEKGRKKRSALLLLGLFLNFGILAFLKYIPFSSELGLLLPLGISFYTFQSMGYLIDVYREKTEAEKNIAKFALFVSFFPQIIQGPIAVYDDLAKQLYVGHKFNIENIKKGLLLILWGALKKLVIADRALALVNLVTKDSSSYSGSYVLFAVILYALQLYADFSGGIDIIRGVAEMFGIKMAENFKRPYFSRSLTEYWHRWHITLGNWCRNYIFYPLSISKKFLNFGKWLKPKFGKHFAKVFPGCVASLLTFIVIGIWHGSNLKYLYFGLWNGIVIMLAELFAPVNKKVAAGFFNKTKLKENGVFAIIVSVLWTFLMVLIGYYFDVASGAMDAFSMLFRSVTDFHITDFAWGNFKTLLESSGLNMYDFYILLISCIALFMISFYKEKKKCEDLRVKILSFKTGRRLATISLGLIILILFGYYGTGISPADFVYMQF
ncbi:MAG: MBOAT family protein [Lachnospiraceae bacterium]|nr:MBOAT family protein [Lachnospiraceae bacterium]